jgi:putative ABC transport system permease protein
MVERVLLLVAGLVALVSALGLVSVMLVALSQRHRELAVLRSVGAGASQVFALVCAESTLVMCAGAALGVLVTVLLASAFKGWVQAEFGLVLLPVWHLTTGLHTVLAFVGLGSVLGLVPAFQAYRRQLQEGLTPKV